MFRNCVFFATQCSRFQVQFHPFISPFSLFTVISFPITEPIVITGIGMITSIGQDRESTWEAMRHGKCGIKRVKNLPGIPDDHVLAAMVDLPDRDFDKLKVIQLNEIAAKEAMLDSGIDLEQVDLERFASAISGHTSDFTHVVERLGLHGQYVTSGKNWWDQFFPATSSGRIASHYNLQGPRMVHSTACASGLIELLTAVRSIRDDQCDIALVGSAEAIDPIFAAGFKNMRALSDSDDPEMSCRPFDKDRNGFVMGEGAAMFVIERMSHAVGRGAKIYAEILGGSAFAEAHHLTGLDMESDSLEHLIRTALKKSDLGPGDVQYINCHGTGTLQNDINEARGIHNAFGAWNNQTCVSSLKSMIGHLVSASGSVEFASTILALRDGYLPPTSNLTNLDPACEIDCIARTGRQIKAQHAMKLSIAFGGHLAAITARRWNDAATGFAYPEVRRAA
ncbi:MAG: hypothetical protein COA78_04410 [Blastopirellula sp.]|nr:MAG: hypothetical protein COA78_04410 [Blastopirellula sp.]